MTVARPITGRQVLWGFIGFFGLIFAANAVLVFLALDSWTGLETEHHYQKGLAYNRVLEADARQHELGWTGNIAARSLPEGRARLEISLSDRDGKPLDGATVVAKFIRPTVEGYDFTTPLTPAGPGQYLAEVALPLAGQWDMRVVAQRADDRFVLKGRAVLK